MSAEVPPGFNQEPQNPQEQRLQAHVELLAYIDRDITGIRDTIEEHRREGHFIPTYEEQLAQFQQLRQAVENGQFAGITALLQQRRTEAEQALAASRQKLRPRGEMPGDDQYFTLKNEILVGQRLSDKVNDAVDDTERAWIAHSIELRERVQYEHTDRGRVIHEINQSNQTVRELDHLQQMVPQPA